MHSEQIEIVLNGERTRVAPHQTVTTLLEELQLHGDRVAVELDKRIVSKRDWPATPVGAGALVEIVEFVGGG